MAPRVTTFDHMDPDKLGWVRFSIPNGSYDIDAPPPEFYHDLIEKNNLEWKVIQNVKACKKTAKSSGACCAHPVNTYTNGHWTCKKHASHPTIPTETSLQELFRKTDASNRCCRRCREPVASVDDLCVTSCRHWFHKECLWKHIRSSTHHYRVDPEETHFACPECRHPLHLFGMHLEDFGEESTFDSMVNMPMDEETLAFLDEYIETHDMSFLLDE